MHARQRDTPGMSTHVAFGDEDVVGDILREVRIANSAVRDSHQPRVLRPEELLETGRCWKGSPLASSNKISTVPINTDVPPAVIP